LDVEGGPVLSEEQSYRDLVAYLRQEVKKAHE